MAIEKDTLDQLLSGRDPKDVFSKDGLFDELKKALAERVLMPELDHHLRRGGGRQEQPSQWLFEEDGATQTSKIDIKVPRDRKEVLHQAIESVSTAFSGLRRENHIDVCAGDDGSRIPGPYVNSYWLEVLPAP